jgi:hypothetical protein
MPSLWDDIKSKVQKGVAVAADKTEELRKIGKVKVDIINVKRSLDNGYKDLGMAVHEHISSGKKGDVKQEAKIKDLVASIDGFVKSLAEKETEIEKIKQDAAAKKAAGGGNTASGTDKTV